VHGRRPLAFGFIAKRRYADQRAGLELHLEQDNFRRDQKKNGHDDRRGSGAFTVRFWILLSVVATVLAAILVRELRSLPSFVTIQEALKPNSASVRLNSLMLEIKGRLKRDSAQELERFASNISVANGPLELYPIYVQLTKPDADKDLAKFGVLILEKGAQRYQTATLIFRAGLEFSVGRFVPKDYVKAERYLSDPLLADNQSARYFLAISYLAPDNPSPDRNRGLGILEELAGSGFGPAQNYLRQRLPGK
jgi:hypothetical protein